MSMVKFVRPWGRLPRKEDLPDIDRREHTAWHTARGEATPTEGCKRCWWLIRVGTIAGDASRDYPNLARGEN